MLTPHPDGNQEPRICFCSSFQEPLSADFCRVRGCGTRGTEEGARLLCPRPHCLLPGWGTIFRPLGPSQLSLEA